MAKKQLYVTQPFLPPLEEYLTYLEQIWESKWLTNAGQFHNRLERELADYLSVKQLALFANGTLALMTALQCLRITGEVITTPYSFVATSHALLWNNIKPVFVDIDPGTCNLDADRIEEAISPQTTAILAVHCYGNPCHVERIQKIADTYSLRVIYDAAHAFGVRYKGESLVGHGDLSILSFHATKIFTTFEGGALVCPDARIKQRVDFLKNFGFADEVTVMAPGINGKMNEAQAALGLLQLKYVDQSIQRRRAIDERYRQALKGIPGIRWLPKVADTVPNCSYFPILVGEGYPLSRDRLYDRMKEQGVHTRRYFYPLISDLPMYRGLPSASPVNLPVAKRIASEVLCLPIYPALTDDEVDAVVGLIRQCR